ncbi:glycosyltransferase family 2 protein [Maliponia aquimaris]|uniref:Beta-monoglucosyldiacylglycerol synthase n=1 Tax=Maliponia aquimaris TaxID=1673631 RepID=A0A238L5L0_9RHOB|nr:glycosyltransferase family 2 protein [Maliponia aquimaris]SMX50268.1 Beta-monoglucosyldiacylglycerol synthase [Maliponia aquimaris]
MSEHRLHLAEAKLAQARARRGQAISHLLMEGGQVAPSAMLRAMAEAARLDQPVPQVLVAEAIASREDVLEAQAQHFGALVLRRADSPPDPALMALLPAEFCLAHGVLPWMRVGDTLLLATSRPDDFPKLLTLLPADIGPVVMALALESDIHLAISARAGEQLAKAAETWVPAEDSCRDMDTVTPARRWLAICAGLLFLGLLAVAPQLLFGAALALALGSLVVSQGLKLAALAALPRRTHPDPVHRPAQLPLVSILVPLFHEGEIAQTLVRRLERLTYPKTLLDVVLVLEAEDRQTRETLARTRLPPWVRTVTVPPGRITTKPRALNYAFRFTRGQIVGIWDAEDAPAPDQLDRVVGHFDRAPPEVGCVQGILDYYNPRANWLSRCFTIEYASWFRVLLPGLARMGLVVPLGGTTVFFRRAVLEEVCGWDAHNVTEDADLGVRLARRGYRTELVASVTREEANNCFWPWIRQRSRWLKGYGITWWVHSRRPVRLWRDLGPRRFTGFQVLFLTTLIQFAFAPVLWSFWLILAGLPHPLDPWLTRPVVLTLTGVFLSAEAVSIVIGLAALARSPHRFLFPWVPTLFAYFPLGTLAIYKALWETIKSPFYWDKTQHGRSAPDAPGADVPPEH